MAINSPPPSSPGDNSDVREVPGPDPAAVPAEKDPTDWDVLYFSMKTAPSSIFKAVVPDYNQDMLGWTSEELHDYQAGILGFDTWGVVRSKHH